MQKYIVRKLGVNKGSPRVYLQIKGLSLAGFEPGKTYSRTVDTENRRLTLTTEANGSYVVSKKECDGQLMPVIDINSAPALKMFEGLEMVRIVISKNQVLVLPLASELKRAKRLAMLKTNLDAGVVTTAGISFGGGVLDHASHAGFADAGLDASLVLANEIDEDLLEHAVQHNDIWRKETIGLSAPMQELVSDDAAMSRLPNADVIAMGIFSNYAMLSKNTCIKFRKRLLQS
jgi:DNA (cytosine-5)-methyltransferase 1